MSKTSRTVKTLNKELKILVDLIPEFAREEFKEEAYIAGGCIYSVYNKEVPKDIDVFIRSKDLKMKLVTYFKDLEGNKVKFIRTGTMVYGKYKGYNLLVTTNAISLGKYQIVLKDVGDPLSVVSAFDYKHNMHYIEDNELKAVDDDYNLDTYDLLFNENRARDIVSTIMRANKFINRGFNLPDEELAKMLLQLNETGFSKEELALLEFSPTSTSFGSGH